MKQNESSYLCHVMLAARNRKLHSGHHKSQYLWLSFSYT